MNATSIFWLYKSHRSLNVGLLVDKSLMVSFRATAGKRLTFH